MAAKTRFGLLDDDGARADTTPVGFFSTAGPIMSEVGPLPPEIQHEVQAGGFQSFRLPPRDLGKFRGVGYLPIGFGLFVIVLVGFMSGAFSRLAAPGDVLPKIIHCLTALPGFLGGFAAIGVGVAILQGHTEIQLTDGWLYSAERWSVFRWRRKCDISKIERFLVSGINQLEVQGKPLSDQGLPEFAALVAELSDGQKFWIAIAYPRDCLLALASRLSSELKTEFSEGAIAVVDLPSTSVGEEDYFAKPAESAIEFREIPGGFSISIPAPGVWQGTGGLFFFSLMWNGIVLLITVAIGAAILSGNAQELAEKWWIPALLLGVFWSVGLGVGLAALNMGRRSVAFAVKNGQLLSIRSGLFGTSRQSWDLSELSTVRVGPSGMEVNDSPVMQVQIVPATGVPRGFLTGRDDSELRWVATLLRFAVQAPEDLRSLPDRIATAGTTHRRNQRDDEDA